jgi:uncharacterized protein YidB (DUF937 family)
MGLLDQLGGLMGGGQQGGQAGGDLTGLVLGMLTGGGGSGLASLVQQFTSAGLGNIVSSWVGTGQNLPISPAQVTQALGHDKVHEFAKQAGVPVEQASGVLAGLLPKLIDQLTPGGALPSGASLLAQAAAMLGGK